MAKILLLTITTKVLQKKSKDRQEIVRRQLAIGINQGDLKSSVFATNEIKIIA